MLTLPSCMHASRGGGELGTGPWLTALLLPPRQNLNHSELVVTMSSEFPDKLKIRKEVHAWPLRFKLRADYCRMSRSFEYGCSCKVLAIAPDPAVPLCTPHSTACTENIVLCFPSSWHGAEEGKAVPQYRSAVCLLQDALLGGRIRLDIPAQEIEYR